MYHQTINSLTSMVLAATLLACFLPSLMDACSPKSQPEVKTTPKPRRQGHMRSFRREAVIEDDEDKVTSISASLKVDDLVRLLEGDVDREDVSVLEWISEGHSVDDFWPLLNLYDKDGNERISRDEIAQVHADLVKVLL